MPLKRGKIIPVFKVEQINNNQHITDDEYDHANKVWNTFMIKTMGEYHDLYLVSDVLLLTDVFENFRKTCLQYYKLDPCHYFTSPGLSWDAMLKMTNIELELMTDIDMFQPRGVLSYQEVGGSWPQILPLKFLLEPQILPPKI